MKYQHYLADVFTRQLFGGAQIAVFPYAEGMNKEQNLVVPVFRYETARKARFNYANWSQSCAPQTAAQEILLFSPKTAHSDSDFHARLLGPRIGVNDDPPIGNAMPAFCGYLCSFDFMQKGTYPFSIDRGEERQRRSVLNIEMDHKGTDALTIRIGGSAVMVAEGTLTVPD